MYSIFIDETQPKPYKVEKIGAYTIQGLKINEIISCHLTELEAYEAMYDLMIENNK